MDNTKFKSARTLVRALFFWLVLLPGIPFVFGSLAIVIYANWPFTEAAWSIQPTIQLEKSVVLITHGKSAEGPTWIADLSQKINRQSGENAAVAEIHWPKAADNLFRCSVNASRIGEAVASDVLKNNPQLQEAHFIAHSAGSFMAYSFCKAVKRARPDIQVKTTYLDASSIYRGIDWTYGTRHFGDCADESEAFYHVGDGVPGSEEALRHGRSTDVTALKPVAWNNGHLWPVEYYLQAVQALENKSTYLPVYEPSEP